MKFICIKKKTIAQNQGNRRSFTPLRSVQDDMGAMLRINMQKNLKKLTKKITKSC